MFNTYKNDMKYLLIPFILFLVACEQSNTPSELKTDIINIEMGGVFTDESYNEKFQTVVGDAEIIKDWDENGAIWETMKGCQYKYPNRNDFGAVVFAIGEDSISYYIKSRDFQILKNPKDGQTHNYITYRNLGDGEWALVRRRDIIDKTDEYRYSTERKVLYIYNISNNTGWTYSW